MRAPIGTSRRVSKQRRESLGLATGQDPVRRAFPDDLAVIGAPTGDATAGKDPT
jgi:hypothetical protein